MDIKAAGKMRVEDLSTTERLWSIVSRLSSNSAIREDLMQEALIHLWQVQEQRPGQTDAWYLQNCRYHLQHYLSAGRSVDSHKRSSSKVDLSEFDGDPSGLVENASAADLVREQVNARDIISALSKRISPREQLILKYLAEGLGTREIARRLKLSHPMIIRHRRKIAALAARLALSPEEHRSRGRKSEHQSASGQPC
jgi:RNA polymerase sigma factor (sigma-70 family)